MKDHYFLAAPVPQEVGYYLIQEAERIGRHSFYRKWTKNLRDYHITLFFFGPLTPERLVTVCGIAEKVTKPLKPFQISISGVGGFGDQNHPRVVFAGFLPCPELGKIQNELNGVLGDCGFTADRRPYHPHITLAKGWLSGEPFADTEETWNHGVGWTIDRISLFAVRQGNPRYRPVRTFLFGDS